MKFRSVLAAALMMIPPTVLAEDFFEVTIETPDDQPEFRLRFFTMNNCRACESWKRANLGKTREIIPVEIVNLSDPKNRRWLGSQTIDGKAIERIRIVPTFWILRRGRNLPERLEQWTGGRSADQIAATLSKIPK
jgi:hypothetical protein